MTEQQLLAQHTVKIIRAEIEHLPYPGRPIVIGPDALEALANEYQQSIPRAAVAAAFLALEHGLRPELFRTSETHAAAMAILSETRTQLGITEEIQ